MKLSKEQFEEIVFSAQNQSMELEFYLNIQNGEVILISDDIKDEELLEEIEEGFNETIIRLPDQDSRDGYNDMIEFTESVCDDEFRRRLYAALEGRKGVFRRFKDELERNEIEQQRYYEFIDNRAKERIKEWLREYTNLELEDM